MKQLLNNKYFVIFLAPFLLGAITILGFSPFGFTIVNFFTFPALLFLISIIKKKNHSKYRKNKNNRFYFYLGCAFGFGFFIFGNYWISISLTHDEMFKGLIPFALLLIPLFLSLFFGLSILIVGNFIDKKISFILFFALIFSIFEFLRGNILTGFPWNLIAYTWYDKIEVIQILSLIGTYSFSLISITFFCVPFLFIHNKIIKRNIFISIFFITIFTCNYFFGLNKIKETKYNFSDSYIVKVISPNFSLSDYQNIDEITQLNRLIKISNPEKNKKTLFIWPEGIFYESNLQNIQKYKSLFKDKFSEKHLIILGINNYINLNNIDDKKYFNSLVLLNNKLEVLSSYNKIKLVPFGEFLPLENIFFKFGFKKITAGYNSFSPGDKRKIINLGKKFENKLILPLICYEIIYSAKVKNKKQLPDLLVNISEDAWFGQSIGPYQHFTKAIYRSVEEGVFTARSANMGISAFIGPDGKVIKSLKTRESGNIQLNFPYFDESTVFSIYGNKIFLFFIFLYIFLILILRKLKV